LQLSARYIIRALGLRDCIYTLIGFPLRKKYPAKKRWRAYTGNGAVFASPCSNRASRLWDLAAIARGDRRPSGPQFFREGGQSDRNGVCSLSIYKAWGIQ
jgi:hypothetical protein